MTDSELYFWSTLAQAFPVLALALVVEIRAITKAYRERNKSAPAIFVWFWAACGLSMVWALSTSIDALRTDENPSLLAERACLLALTAAVGVVVTNPVIYMVTAKSAPIIALVSSFSYMLLKFKVQTSFRHWQTKRFAAQTRELSYETLQLAKEKVDLCAKHVSLTGRLPRPLTEYWHSEVEEAHADLTASLADVGRREQKFRATVRDELNAHVWLRLARVERDKLIASHRRARREAVRTVFSSLDSTGVFTVNTSGLLEYRDPDDGGFFDADEASPMTDFRSIPYLATSFDDFREPEE